VHEIDRLISKMNLCAGL